MNLKVLFSSQQEDQHPFLDAAEDVARLTIPLSRSQGGSGRERGGTTKTRRTHTKAPKPSGRLQAA